MKNMPTAMRELTAYKEQLEVLRKERFSLKDMFNHSAVIVGESSPLLSSLVEEYANYRAYSAPWYDSQKISLLTKTTKLDTTSTPVYVYTSLI